MLYSVVKVNLLKESMFDAITTPLSAHVDCNRTICTRFNQTTGTITNQLGFVFIPDSTILHYVENVNHLLELA